VTSFVSKINWLLQDNMQDGSSPWLYWGILIEEQSLDESFYSTNAEGPGPTACLKKKLEKGEKIPWLGLGSLETTAIQLTLKY